MPLIEVEDVTKIYRIGVVDVAALNGVTLSIEQGEMVAVMGPSGSGKSTLMNILGCLDVPTSGSYRIEGDEVGDWSDDRLAETRNRRIGFIFQTYNLLPVMSALMNVALPTIFAGMSTAEGEKRALECLSIVGLDDRAHHLPSELSGGQQQRVAIARAFVNKPRIILADEPTGNLDSNTGQEIIDYMKTLNEETGTTIITVTHDDKMLSVADRMAWIRDGRLERIANRDEIDIRMGSIKEQV